MAVLGTNAVSIYLGDGQGGFSRPSHVYNAGPDPTGLTVADVDARRQARPARRQCVRRRPGAGWATATARSSRYLEADQSVALAVADLTGNGTKDIIYANQSLDRVVVDYGGGQTIPVGASTGLLAPGAVAVADLNGDGIPDLIVANSGSNNVLIYPGLGNGQFGPAAQWRPWLLHRHRPGRGSPWPTSTATGDPTWWSPTRAPTTSSILLNQVDSRRQLHVRSGAAAQ